VFQPLERKNYLIDQGTTWRDCRRWSPGGVAFNFGGCTAVLDLRVSPSTPQPTIRVSTVPSSLGLVGLDVLGNYWWEVEAIALAPLLPLQRALAFALRVTYADGVRRDDLLTGVLYLRQNGVLP
jgi:hypothetical protein